MAITLDELAELLDTEVQIVTNDAGNEFTVRLVNAKVRVGSGPELEDVVATDTTIVAAKTDYVNLIKGRRLVVGNIPRGTEVRVPSTLIP